jgi:hypothetical protein
MPPQQQGTVVKRGPRNYGARYMDEHYKRRYQGGFETQTAAAAWLRTKVDAVAALRRGDTPTPGTLPTVAELIDTFLATHEVDPATTNKMKYELAHARRAFGTRRIDELRPLAGMAGHAAAADAAPAVRHLQAGAGAGGDAGPAGLQPVCPHP